MTETLFSFTNQLVSLKIASELISSGYPLSIAGPEALLDRLPAGNWIGGTSVYHLSAEGGVRSIDHVLITHLPAGIGQRIESYDSTDIQRVLSDAPENGFSMIIMPAGCSTLQRFSAEARRWEGVFDKPLVGWVAGFDLEQVSPGRPMVYDGRKARKIADGAVVFHIALAPEQLASVEAVNIFERRPGLVLHFPNEGTRVDRCLVNGTEHRLVDVLSEYEDSDGKLPLLGDYLGTSLNVSIESVNRETGLVTLFAPVFPDVDYFLALPPEDYAMAIADRFVSRQTKGTICTFCCILHYRYGNFAGRQIMGLRGPVSFGEIAYLVHNQTIVLLRVQ